MMTKFLRAAFLVAVPCLSVAHSDPVPASEPVATPSLIDQLTPGQIEAAIDKIKSAGSYSEQLSNEGLERAKFQGLLSRLGETVRLVPKDAGSSVPAAEVFRAQKLPRGIVYVRLGDLNQANVDALIAELSKKQKISGVIVDLRATKAGDSFDLAARVINVFAQKGAPYFHLAGDAQNGQGKVFTGSADPLFTRGVLALVVNADSSGPAEAIAAALRQQSRALIVGTPTQGRAFQFESYPVNDQTVLQIAVARVVVGNNSNAGGVQPDVAVATDLKAEREVLQKAATEGIEKFIFEIERPHMNEASLVAGRNPELDLYQARQAGNSASDLVAPLDKSLQRALDTVTSVLVVSGSK
ncbi:MAG TPA: S41 family peptidase [Chthoniobacterales bacterium]